jgi:4-hydroxythreonine-4-phosphate dehydrogenase
LAGVGTLVVTGGETARAVLMAAGVDQLVVRGELEPGVVWSTVSGRALSVMTKAGAFGDPGVLVRCIEAVKKHGGIR